VVSIVLLLVPRDPRVVLLKPSVNTLIAAVYLYATCIIGRPVVYVAATPLATQGDPVRLRAYREAWEVSPLFRSRERLVTAGFGTALLLEAVFRVVIVLSLPGGDRPRPRRRPAARGASPGRRTSARPVAGTDAEPGGRRDPGSVDAGGARGGAGGGPGVVRTSSSTRG
jgi:hypothetical protein